MMLHSSLSISLVRAEAVEMSMMVSRHKFHGDISCLIVNTRWPLRNLHAAPVALPIAFITKKEIDLYVRGLDPGRTVLDRGFKELRT